MREAEFESSNFHNLQALNDINLVQNVDKFNCPICFSDIDIGEGVTLQECLHNFCRECLASTIQFSETAVVKCPFQNIYKCEFNLQEREIKALVAPDVYQKFLKRSIVLAESEAQNSFHCKTPDCPGWCLFEDTVNFFLCPVCKHTNCLTCDAIHEGKNCRQFQDDVIFRSDSSEEVKKTKEYLKDMLDSGRAMKCPQCQVIIMKKGGCCMMRCSICNRKFLWLRDLHGSRSRLERRQQQFQYMNMHDLPAYLQSNIFNSQPHTSPDSSGLQHNSSTSFLDQFLPSDVSSASTSQGHIPSAFEEAQQLTSRAFTKMHNRNRNKRKSNKSKWQEQHLQRMQTLENQIQAVQQMQQHILSNIQANIFGSQSHASPFSQDLQQDSFAPSLNQDDPTSSFSEYHRQQEFFHQDQHRPMQSQPKQCHQNPSTSFQQTLKLSNIGIGPRQLVESSASSGQEQISSTSEKVQKISSSLLFSKISTSLPKGNKRKRSEEKSRKSKMVKSEVCMMPAENKAQKKFHCKTPLCYGSCLIQDNIDIFMCPVCKHTNCLICAAIHEGKSCEQFLHHVPSSLDSNEEDKKT